MFIPRDFSRPAVRREWIDALLGPLPERRWEEMACELFAWQFARVPEFRRLCEGHGVSPATLRSWREIPAMPQQLFKRAKLFAHGDAKPAATYETSGTTTGEPGRQHLLHTDIYEAVCVAGARRIALFDGAPEFHFIATPPRQAPHSSLGAMFGFWSRAAAKNRGRFWMGAEDFAELRGALAQTRKPVALCGTAFGFVHFLDSLAGRDLPLPRGSWLLETGGFKGRSREIPKPELYAQLARTFRVPDRAIWNGSSIRRPAAKSHPAARASCAGSISPMSTRSSRCKRSIARSGRRTVSVSSDASRAPNRAAARSAQRIC
jgi:hypothetical protein